MYVYVHNHYRKQKVCTRVKTHINALVVHVLAFYRNNIGRFFLPRMPILVDVTACFRPISCMCSIRMCQVALSCTVTAISVPQCINIHIKFSSQVKSNLLAKICLNYMLIIDLYHTSRLVCFSTNHSVFDIMATSKSQKNIISLQWYFQQCNQYEFNYSV